MTNTPGTNSACARQRIDSSSQADYRGVLAGTTSSKELVNLLGQPTDIEPAEINVAEWDFDSNVSVIVEEGTVELVYIQPPYEKRSSVSDAVETYGCPDLIFAVDRSVEGFGEYSGTVLVYLKLGIDFSIEQFPPSLSDKVILTTYFKPMSPDGYLEANPKLRYKVFAKQVFWQDIFDN